LPEPQLSSSYCSQWRSSPSRPPPRQEWRSVHEADINRVAANGIARGYSQDRFGPDDPVTRGQMASFLSRALDDLAEPDRDFFPDDTGSVHEADINRIAANGIAEGYPSGEFRPEAQP
jgi:hypothetical protein